MSVNSAKQGGCLCGEVRFEVHGRPMIVHACHCTRCQQRSGSAVAINLWIEEDRVQLLSGELERHGELVDENGNASESWRCAKCGFGLWTIYHSAPRGSLFVRAGCLDDPSEFPPDVHIFTRSKQPWITIPDDVPSFEQYYNFKETWSDESQQRFRDLKNEVQNAT